MFSGKRVLVCGMARSGHAAVRLLHGLGADVVATDVRQDVDLSDLPEGIPFFVTCDALAADFDTIVISPGISIYEPFLQTAIARSADVLGEAELAFRLSPCPWIAITGTNGKTTVTTLVYDIMKLANPHALIGGNIGMPLCDLSPTKDGIIVAEISSFMLETTRDFSPHVSAILNITPDHIDRHRTFEIYSHAKARIFENQRSDAICVLNLDDPNTCGLRPKSQVMHFSERVKPAHGAYIADGFITLVNSDGQSVSVVHTAEITVGVPNALAAAAIAYAAGASPQHIAQGLQQFAGLPHRMELVLSGIHNVYNDSKATNPESTIHALNSMSAPVVLICGGYKSNADFTHVVQLFKKKVSHAVFCGDNANDFVVLCESVGYSDFTVVSDLPKAVSMAFSKAAPGQAILFSPASKSFDRFKDFAHRGDTFKQIVQDIQDTHV